MADLDAEFARFQAELAALEQTASSRKEEEAAEGSVDSKKRPRDEASNDDGAGEKERKVKKVEQEAPVVISAKPMIYSAPPRPVPVKATPQSAPDPSKSSGHAAWLARGALSATTTANAASAGGGGGALSGFPVGTSGEFAASASTAYSSAPRPQAPVNRVDMVTGEILPVEEQQLMNQQQSVYEYDPNRPIRASGGDAGPNGARGDRYDGSMRGKPKRNLRMAGGEVWEDPTLADWPDNDFRLFVGDLGNETNDEILAHAFSRYPSFQRARIVRDKHSHKTRGYGFISFSDPFDCAKAMREMNGKYIGNRPVKIQKSNWQDRNIDVARKKAKKKNKHHLFG